MADGLRWDFPHRSPRMPVLADRVVATSQPLATSAGLAAFTRGGSAVDAIVAAAIALTVVEPTSNGIGSDAFAIVHDGERLHGLNASGRSPRRLDPGRYLGRGPLPARGWDPVTVPGAVAGWAALHARFGRLELAELAAPAVRYAREGFPVSPITARAWAAAERTCAPVPGFGQVFLPGGRAPRPGERFACPDQAVTLERIARTAGADLYRGQLAEQIVAAARRAGAPLDREDLEDHRSTWVDPLAVDFEGWRLFELPPNGQGLAALQAAALLARARAAAPPDDPAADTHLQIEAMKLAFADAHAHIADPEAMRTPPEALLDTGYLDARAEAIDPRLAGQPGAGRPGPGGTVYLAAAGDGLAVSYIQSNYMGFGSGVVVPGTGIALANRGAGFSTEAGHPNAVAPAKRPFSTIIPGFALAPSGERIAFGVMGGPMQPQGHLQLLARMAGGENPQAAVDAPRWRVEGDARVHVEPATPAAVVAGLRARGHEVAIDHGPDALFGYGGAQVVRALGDAWLAASDPRKDGQAAGW